MPYSDGQNLSTRKLGNALTLLIPMSTTNPRTRILPSLIISAFCVSSLSEWHNSALKLQSDILCAHIRNNRAVGVEYLDDEKDAASVNVALAAKLVVLSAGAFGSPTILERSGIGASSILANFSIPQLVDLPGVGENYMGMSPPSDDGTC